MKMIDHNHFICHLILGTFTEYPEKDELYYFLKSAGLYRNICTNIFGICTKKRKICTNFPLNLIKF